MGAMLAYDGVRGHQGMPFVELATEAGELRCAAFALIFLNPPPMTSV